MVPQLYGLPDVALITHIRVWLYDRGPTREACTNIDMLCVSGAESLPAATCLVRRRLC